MSDTVRVNVTTRHIDQGDPCNVGFCALVLAIRDAGFPFATVGIETVWLDGYEGSRYAVLPPEAISFRARFDTGRPVSPIAFDLDARQVEGVRA